MQNLLSMGVDVIMFWFFEAPRNLIRYFSSLNTAFLKLSSFQVLARTYFKPWKNEYREGLVGFSIFMGIVFKSFILMFDFIILVILLIMEVIVIVLYVVWPFVTVGVLFVK